MSDSKRTEAEIYAALGEMLVTWNRTESMVRFIIVWFYGLGDKGDILTAHMGSRTLDDAMNTLAEEFSDNEFKPHLKHFVSYLDTLRAYRNFYAHSIAIVGFNEAGAPIGLAQETQAKGKLLLTQEHVTAEQIRSVTAMCKTLHSYGSAIVANAMREMGAPVPELPPLSSLEKPPLPEQLKKTRLRLLELRRQDQASRPSQGPQE